MYSTVKPLIKGHPDDNVRMYSTVKPLIKGHPDDNDRDHPSVKATFFSETFP